MGVKVVDQLQVFGQGLPGCVVLDDGALKNAEELGRKLVEQALKGEGEREYVGPQGRCPVCHLNLVRLTGGDRAECAACGAKGRVVLENGELGLVFGAKGLDCSVLRHEGLAIHMKEIVETAGKLNPRMLEVPERKSGLVELGNKWIIHPPSMIGPT